MEESRSLYMMLSRTETSMGKTIRFFTNYDYNHVSLSLDPGFRNWVSFARYAKDVPLAGGFVPESPERFFESQPCVPVKIFRFDIPEERYRKLKALFSQAGQPGCGLIYNSIGALLTPVGLPCPVPGAYTCLEFANAVLEERHPSIRALDAKHQAELIHKGDLHELVSDSGERSSGYFKDRGFWRGTADTLYHFARLLRRMLCRHRPDPIARALHT